MGQITVNLDMPSYFGTNTWLSVHALHVPQIGYNLVYEDKDYEILTVTTYQEKVGDVVIITHVLKCLEIDEDGADVGNEPITLKIDGNAVDTGITVR